MDLKYLIENNLLDSNKVTELVCNGTVIWKGLSDNLCDISENYKILKFLNDDTEEFNKAYYKIAVESLNINENRLPSDKDTDPEYGLPEDKKYPLFDKNHVESAIKFFNYVSDKKKESELAGKIISKMKKYNIPFDTIGEKNRLKNYIPSVQETGGEELDENFKQAYRDGGEKLEKYLDGKAKAQLMSMSKNHKTSGLENHTASGIKNLINKAADDVEKRYEKRASAKNEKEKSTGEK